jgi:RNA-binding protein
MLADELTGKQRRHLRALGHHLDPVVQVGHEGVNDAVIRQTDAQLDAHELIKVKIGESSPQDRHEAAELLAGRTQAQVAQVLGRTALLYRPRKEKPQIVLPE